MGNDKNEKAPANAEALNRCAIGAPQYKINKERFKNIRVNMKVYTTCSALTAATCLLLLGCESKHEHIYQLSRCGVAASLDINSDPAVLIRSEKVIFNYMHRHGIERTYKELTNLTNHATEEIMGTPDSPNVDWPAKAQEIVESDFCKTNLV